MFNPDKIKISRKYEKHVLIWYLFNKCGWLIGLIYQHGFILLTFPMCSHAHLWNIIYILIRAFLDWHTISVWMLCVLLQLLQCATNVITNKCITLINDNNNKCTFYLWCNQSSFVSTYLTIYSIRQPVIIINIW